MTRLARHMSEYSENVFYKDQGDVSSVRAKPKEFRFDHVRQAKAADQLFCRGWHEAMLCQS